jgi:3,4-dihydroxy 2-butanone 4-phosphate synthase/GTP cyclohydrolase II
VTISDIPAVIEALRAGSIVLVADDEDRENEGDAIMAAEFATKASIAWIIRHSSGLLCAPMAQDVANRLQLPLMVVDNQDPKKTAYTITADAAQGITTGISAFDRARTLRVLADPDSEPSDLIRPGHVLPLRSVPGGVNTRPGHTEAAVDLMLLAGLSPVAVIAEIVEQGGDMMRLTGLQALAKREGLLVTTIAQLHLWLGNNPQRETAIRARNDRGLVNSSGR